MRTVHVPLADGRSYDVSIGPNLLGGLAPYVRKARVPVITDENVARLHLDRLEGMLAELSVEAGTLVLPAGEKTKSFAKLEQVCDFLLDFGMERDDTLIAFGGGVIGDLAGFAASMLKRGASFVQVPTTLLAQVDSSVGGKTGINTRQGKNLIGAFHQPVAVLADTDFLATLPDEEVRAGLAEIIKIAAARDAAFLDWLSDNAPLSGDALEEAIARAVQMKADIVVADEREAGVRALLNLGHTFGHALEAEAPGQILHGVAVAAGMGAAFALSAQQGYCPKADVERMQSVLRANDLPATLAAAPGGPYAAENLLARMRDDKKNRNGKIRLVLARALGDCFVTDDVDEETLLAFLQEETRS